MQWKGFQRPKRVEVDAATLTPTYGRFTAQPFERGFATTVGNAMRRALLSSIEGAAITAVQIEGVLHEFSSIPGVVEDVTDIILNLKQVPIRLHSEESRILSLDAAGPGQVTAADLNGDGQAEICDPDLPLGTLNEEGKLKLQVHVANGAGLRQRRPQLLREHGHRLDSGRLGPQPREAGELQGRGGPPRPDDRLRAADPGRLDQRHDLARGGGVDGGHPCCATT